MRFPPRLIALPILAAALIGGLWLLARDTGPIDFVPDRPAATTSSAPEEVATLVVPGATGGPTQPTRQVAPELAAENRPLAIPDDAIWVKGRVIFPPGTPPDEEVRVVARGRAFPNTDALRTHEVEVGPDGSFQVAFAPGTQTGSVWLEAHYLYLSQDFQYDPDNAPDEVLLSPAVGGRILMTVSLKANDDPRDLDGIQISTRLSDASRDMDYHSRDVDEHANGVFEIPALPPGYPVIMTLRPTEWFQVQRVVEPLLPGETRQRAVAMSGGVRLAGRVLDEDGKPLKRARLYAQTRLELEQDEPQFYTVRVKSDNLGRFDFRGIRPGEVSLHATHKEHAGTSRELGALQEGAARKNLVLTLKRGGTVSGRVVDDRGEPPSKFRVKVSKRASNDTEGFDSTRHNDVSGFFRSPDGRFELKGIPDGTWDAVAGYPGYAAAEPVPVEVPQSGELLLVIERNATVRGKVVDFGGQPLKGAAITAQEAQGDSITFVEAGKVISERGGVYEISLAPGAYELRSSCDGYADSAVTTLTVYPGGLREGFTLVLRAAASVSGILDPSLHPVIYREVDLYHPDGSHVNATRTDERGYFRFEDLEPGRYQAVLQESEVLQIDGEFAAVGADRNWPTSLPSVSFSLEEGQHRQIVLGRAVGGAVRISGQVTSGGTPIPGLDFWWSALGKPHEFGSTTDESGRYTVDASHTGQFTLGIGGDWMARFEARVEVPASVRQFEFDIELPETRVAGNLVDPQGNPVGSASVRLSSQAHGVGIAYRDLSDEKGAFSMDGVRPGPYELVIEEVGGWLGSEPRFGLLRLEDLVVPKSGIDDLQLSLPKPATIVGIVSLQDGTHASGYVVTATSNPEEPPDFPPPYSSFATGRYTYGGLGPGTYWVQASLIGSTSAVHKIQLTEGSTYTLNLVIDCRARRRPTCPTPAVA